MKTFCATIGLFLLFALFLVTCQSGSNNADVELTPEELVERGDYLVTSIGCDDCHTPKKMGELGPEPDLDRRLMGHPADLTLPEYEEAWVAPGQWVLGNSDLTAWVGPWGTSYSANLTSDETGIGVWSEENFIRAMREGLYKGLQGSRSLLPPMPWPQYRNLNDDDLKAIFAFLQSTYPLENVVPAAKINPPPE